MQKIASSLLIMILIVQVDVILRSKNKREHTRNRVDYRSFSVKLAKNVM